MRALGIFLAIFGFYLIFTPIILLLEWIPLIGALLSGIAVLATFLFACICGLTLSFASLAMAWILFRPLVAMGLLTITCSGIYFLCFWEAVGVW